MNIDVLLPQVLPYPSVLGDRPRGMLFKPVCIKGNNSGAIQPGIRMTFTAQWLSEPPLRQGPAAGEGSFGSASPPPPRSGGQRGEASLEGRARRAKGADASGPFESRGIPP